MNDTYTKAQFWKCALQVNPYGYNEKYRGAEQGMPEDEYNRQILEICRQENRGDKC